MKKVIGFSLLLLAMSGCTKDKCYIILNSAHQELCSKCFHTTDERSTWMKANEGKTPEQLCQ